MERNRKNVLVELPIKRYKPAIPRCPAHGPEEASLRNGAALIPGSSILTGESVFVSAGGSSRYALVLGRVSRGWRSRSFQAGDSGRDTDSGPGSAPVGI